MNIATLIRSRDIPRAVPRPASGTMRANVFHGPGRFGTLPYTPFAPDMPLRAVVRA